MHADDGFLINSANRPDVDPNGMYDVVMHGGPDGFYMPLADGSFEHISPQALGATILSDPNYTAGQPIRLLSCETGAKPDGAAQQLSNFLGVDVLAPDKYMWAWPDGSLLVAGQTTIADVIVPGLLGTMKWFTPSVTFNVDAAQPGALNLTIQSVDNQ